MRTTDETLTPSERVNRILGAYGNSNNVLVISNHLNAGGGDWLLPVLNKLGVMICHKLVEFCRNMWYYNV